MTLEAEACVTFNIRPIRPIQFALISLQLSWQHRISIYLKKVKYFGKKPHFLFSERQMTHSVCLFVFLGWFALNCIDLWPQFWHFFLHQNGSNVKNWPPINTHQAPLGSGISTRDGIFSNDNDQSNIIIDRYHTFTFCLLVQEFPLKRRTFDRLFEYLSRSLCSETETIFFVNVTLASTFVNVTLAWLELNLCHLKKREDRIFSNYSDFRRLRNKSRESKKGNIDIFLKKNYL